VARIIDEGWVEKNDPMFTEGVRVEAVVKQSKPKELEDQTLGEDKPQT